MHVLITGGGGMIGRKLAERIAADGTLNGREVTRLTLQDVVEPAKPAGAAFPVETRVSDLSQPGEADSLLAGRPEVIFHLAAIVSGEAETDFDKGYRVNLTGTWALLEAIRKAGHAPRLVFSSSIAVYGAPFPEPIPDDFFHTPLTSYGAQKACGELLLADYTRKGFVDGIGIRLPTICIRPGKPNKAASGFFSGILREPLAGIEAVCPVDEGVRHWMASPRAAIGFMLHAAGIDGAAVGPRRNLSMPGLCVSIREMLDALRRVAGDRVADRVRFERDDFIASIVSGWPQNFDARRAVELGFQADPDFDTVIRLHIEDELGGKIA
ncbi:nucleoside-diphosphate-sugar epimerase [Tepidamorphus gemmatus]|uniref:Nucleoside-diphosphate-sugar epimerase n=1 Tax=Tepidamorphus gemmatus TaxID=747076 RepID=A0A4R3LXP4_9HYPH|nr:D-erythronate dehydrogenase [Tepidamorphus gemmatus]TCT05430.1 nucleoside-diphosphate-sugar epimerase [Tepidamorphus gemmatus]